MTSVEPIWIVGAGPGDPDLITLKGRNLLARADVVVYTDSLVPKQLLTHCRPEAECIPTARKTLEDIIDLLVARSQAGLCVVRLHDGDPCLYGAIAEQISRLAEAGIPCEVVPGIGAYQLAAARLRAELTAPGGVQTIILTRAGGRTGVPETEELASLAAHRASLCLYLSARHVEDAQARLLAHYPPETPVAICFRLGWPDERIWRVPLAEMAATSRREGLERTTLYLIGSALAPTHGRSHLYHPQWDHLFRPHGDRGA